MNGCTVCIQWTYRISRRFYQKPGTCSFRIRFPFDSTYRIISETGTVGLGLGFLLIQPIDNIRNWNCSVRIRFPLDSTFRIISETGTCRVRDRFPFDSTFRIVSETGICRVRVRFLFDSTYTIISETGTVGLGLSFRLIPPSG